MFTEIKSDLIDFLLPKRCINCGLYKDIFLCDECEGDLEEYIPESFVTRKSSLNWEIEESEKSNTKLIKVYYFYVYNDLIHRLIIKLKYGFLHELSTQVVNLFFNSNEFQKIDFNNFDVITYVPTSKQREGWRGFNHTRIIAWEIANRKKLPFCEVLIKVKNTKPQIELSRNKRLENLTNSILVKNDLPINLENKKVLIIDDILTTGSTLDECASAITNQYPNSKVYGMCLARGKD